MKNVGFNVQEVAQRLPRQKEVVATIPKCITGRVCWFNVCMNHQDLVNINVHVVRHLESSCAPRGCVSNTDFVSPHYSGWCRPHRKVNGGFSLDSDIFCLFKTFYSQKFILGAKQASPRPRSWVAFVSWRCASALACFAFCFPGS